jgi:hypothetical protein
MALPGFSFQRSGGSATPFYAEGAGPWYADVPPPERIEEVAHVPYSAINIVDDGGDGMRDWEIPIIVAAADVAAMEANRGQTGTLITPRGTWTNSKLAQLRGKQWTADGTLCRYEALFHAGVSA